VILLIFAPRKDISFINSILSRLQFTQMSIK
jgi:hypothetical protein